MLENTAIPLKDNSVNKMKVLIKTPMLLSRLFSGYKRRGIKYLTKRFFLLVLQKLSVRIYYPNRDCRKSTCKAPKLKLPEILFNLNHYAAPGQVYTVKLKYSKIRLFRQSLILLKLKPPLGAI